jgi:hypothetical protein
MRLDRAVLASSVRRRTMRDGLPAKFATADSAGVSPGDTPGLICHLDQHTAALGSFAVATRTTRRHSG